MDRPLHLLPVPRSLERLSGTHQLREATTVSGGSDAARGRVLQSLALRSEVRAAHGDPPAPIELRMVSELPAEGYRLHIAPNRIELEAGSAQGLLWAAGALDQILCQRGRELPCLRIEDWPDFPVRGYMLDISRDRVPTSSALQELVRTLSSLRINQLQLYTEHTFAYRDHETVWRDASPLTPDDVRSLDATCAAHGIELVPNQNSFGHMERWLRHPRYAHLAELAEPAGPARARTCLAPGEESVTFIRQLYAELLPCFSSRVINIGCDETIELGRGRSLAACEQRGRGRVYLDHLLELIAGLRGQDYVVQFWGDMLGQHPELIRELPEDGVIALLWGYEAPRDPAGVPGEVVERQARAGIDLADLLGGFTRRVRPFLETGLPFYVCPGTSSWNSLLGRWPNARANLLDAAEVGLAQGAAGYLITDWGDNGHLQPPAVSLPAIAYGATLSWCLESGRDVDLEGGLGALLLEGDEGCAPALLRLGAVYEQLGLDALNASPLSYGLLRPLDAKLPCWGELDRAGLGTVVKVLDDARTDLGRTDASVVGRELAHAAGLARHGAWRLGLSQLQSGPSHAELRADLEALIEQQAEVWALRSRPGGLHDSLERLRQRLSDYETSGPTRAG